MEVVEAVVERGRRTTRLRSLSVLASCVIMKRPLGEDERTTEEWRSKIEDEVEVSVN